MDAMGCEFRRHLWLSLVPLTLSLPFAARAEYTGAPNDSVLYNPALSISEEGDEVVFRGQRITYTYSPAIGEWRVRREDNAARLPEYPWDPYVYRGSEGTWCFDGGTDGRKGVLGCWRGADTTSTPVWRLPLWDGAVFQEKYNAPSGMPSPTEPEVTGVAALDGKLWISIGHYAGEESDGTGSLVCFDPSGRLPVRVVQPDTLQYSSLGPIASADGALWLGTCIKGEFGTYKNLGLVRYGPTDSSIAFWPPVADPLGGDIVTALLGTADAVWFATDAGMGRLRLSDRKWERWRIVPSTRMKDATPVHSHPGLPPRGHLPPGDYEVRWIDNRDHEGWMELVTPGVATGWIRNTEFEELAAGCYKISPIIIASFIMPDPEPVELVSSPKEKPAAALLIRAVPHPTGSSWSEEASEESWIEIRANIGWIAPAARDIELKVVRDLGGTEAVQGDGMPSETPE